MHALKRGWLLLLSLGVVVAACGRQQGYAVDGVQGRFCVPEGYPPEGAWFVPKDTSATPHGFSFMGCGLLNAELQKTCGLPGGLISASVMPLSVSVNQTWAKLKDAALFHAVVSGNDATYETEDKTGRLRVYNPKAWPAWFIWRGGFGGSARMPNSLKDSDELVMSCSGAAVFPGGNGGLGTDEYVCERYVRGKAYALKYKFVSEVPMPGDQQIRQFENRLFRQVDMWKCTGR